MGEDGGVQPSDVPGDRSVQVEEVGSILEADIDVWSSCYQLIILTDAMADNAGQRAIHCQWVPTVSLRNVVCMKGYLL